MLAQGMLWEEQGILGIGQKGEETYGRRHFLELLSVFLSPPLFAVLHGRQELGFVDELTFLGKQEGSPRAAPGRPGLARDPHRLAAESRPRRGLGGPGPDAMEGRRPRVVLPALPGDQAGVWRRTKPGPGGRSGPGRRSRRCGPSSRG